MKFDEHGEINRPLTRSEHEQLVALLEAGVNYRDVAEMFDVNARELKFYGFEND